MAREETGLLRSSAARSKRKIQGSRSSKLSESMSRPSLEVATPEQPPTVFLPPLPGTAAPPTPPNGHPREKRQPRRRLWPYFAVLFVLAVAGCFIAVRRHRAAVAADAKKKAPPPATPVVAAKAVSGNIGVYVTGLGAITPIYTVTVKSRVDGQLMSVHFKEGDLVHQGEPLIEIDPRPYEAVVEQTEGQLSRDQALLANAHIDLDRYTKLLADAAIPQQQYATQAALVKQDEGIVKNDEGLLDAAKLNVVYSHITSPITGIVGLRLVDPGNIVHAADTNGMLVITQVQPISAIFTISEDQLGPVVNKVRAGQKLSVDAWDREMKNKLATGVLSTFDNVIDQTTGTLKLRAIFDNANRTLFPNQFVNARLLQQEKTGVTLLPSAAIQRNTNDTYVYLVKADSTVTVRSIKVGTTEGDQSQITSGLSPGDTVVMTGVEKLQEGSKVAVSMNGSK